MKKGTMIWIGVGIIVLLILLYAWGAYNNFVGLDANVQKEWSETENQYQRQADLIENLVSVTASSVKVETAFVKDVIAARSAWDGASTQLAKDAAGQQMNNGVTAFVKAVAESYPTLQANKQYITLTDNLEGTQNRITTARGRYIEAVKNFNVAVKRFPANMFAGMFGFSEKEYYHADEGNLETPSLGTGALP